MTNFLEKYASYYDVIYAEKDYSQEAFYVDALICRYGKDIVMDPGFPRSSGPRMTQPSPFVATAGRQEASAQSILEFGCGTGRHAIEFAQKGYTVHGVDLSESMVRLAKQRASLDSNHDKMNFECADIRTVRLHKTFDTVISLFHVMSYQTTNQDLLAAFQSAAQHLKSGGLFIFDAWYGPSVQEQGYHTKVKRLGTAAHAITRISEPHFYSAQHRIDVQFTMFVQDTKTQVIECFDEMHPMRYLFKPEIEATFEQVGFEMVTFEEWLTGGEPTNQSWSVCCVGRKR